MNEIRILSICSKIKDIKLEFDISEQAIIILDFYNIYCSFVKFNKYKTFSKKTITICIDVIMKKIKNNDVILVSKNIFEIDTSYIKNITMKYSNIRYVLVEDKYPEKSFNRERDDYACILLQKNILSSSGKKCFIITNDRYKNYNDILNKVKPMNLKIFQNGKETYENYMDSVSIIKENQKFKKNPQVITCKFNVI